MESESAWRRCDANRAKKNCEVASIMETGDCCHYRVGGNVCDYNSQDRRKDYENFIP